MKRPSNTLICFDISEWLSLAVCASEKRTSFELDNSLPFMDYPIPASYSIGGILTWAGLVIFISIFASLFPALRAVRLTVTEVLAYE